MIIVIAISAIVLLLLVAAALSNGQYLIEREVIIDRPKQVVFDYIKCARNQEQYNKWVMQDPNSKKTLSGIDGTVGSVYAWDSTNKNVGKGEEEIKSIVEGQRIEIEVRFEKPFRNIAGIYMITEAIAQEHTRVKYGFSGKLTYGMKVLYLLLNLKKALGKDMETSLYNLKTVLEK